MKHPYLKIAEKGNIHAGNDKYKKLVIHTFVRVLRVIFFSKAFFHLCKGIYYSIRKKELEKQKEFLDGSCFWGVLTQQKTKAEVKFLNDIIVPEKGHLIFLNHVNELDFPFDCLVLKKPFLANQEIKNTYIAYWWMKAMGSEVFDKSDKRTIAKSVKNLLKSLKNRSFVVYPEGKVTYSEDIKSLKKGMINLSFKLKIPILIILKSGLTGYQEKPNNHTIAYKSCGVIKPDSFSSWEEYRDHIFQLMDSEKRKLDEEIGIRQKTEKQEDTKAKVLFT
ncbi:MAG: 1-acyl-sn-glycerol-3-phosphate acyltransferase [Spirochaetota bacterium]